MSDGQTHWEGCWAERGHHECAQQKIRDLLAEKRLNKQRARNALRFLGGDPQKPTIGRITFGLPEFCTSPRGGFMDMTTTAHTERSERQTTPYPTRRCGYCGESLDGLPQSARYCSAKHRRADFDERAKDGKVASVRRLKGGRMSVVLHMEHDVGIEPGQVVRVAGDSARPDSTRSG